MTDVRHKCIHCIDYIDIKNLFKENANYLDRLSAISYAELKKQMKTADFDIINRIIPVEEVSDEENEELGRILDSLTEDDLQVVRTEFIYV